MANYTLANKSICATINSDCSTMTLSSKVDWANLDPSDGGPVDTNDIISIDINIIFDGNSDNDVNLTSYVNDIEITPENVNQTESFSDGVYQISVTYSTATDSYNYSFVTATLCNLECKIDKLTLEVVNDPCSDCDEKKNSLYCLLSDLTGLKANLACGNISQFEFVLEQMNDTLINLNCNNC